MKVLIIGDIIIDKYIYGTSKRLSPEAPVPVVTQERTVETQGGAGLVFKNLESLGVDVELFNYYYPKSTKTRVLCDGHYITRIDDDVIVPGENTLEDILKKDFSEYTFVILSDYNKGVLEYSNDIIKHINSFNCKVIVDPKRHISCYEGAWLIKPNSKEYKEFEVDQWTGNFITTNAGDNVIADIDNIMYSIPVENVEVSDVTGAGDCFLAGFVYGLTKGYDFKKALELGVRGSTESVKHVGTYILTEKDLIKRVVFTNGCFDVLHKGHLTLLKEARMQGDKLIVGLNSDESVKRLKGDSRPINDVNTRKEQLLLIPYVDEVIIFDHDTPYKLIKEIQPDLIVKGGDYTVEEIVGHDLAPVYIVPTVKGHSTTRIIDENIDYRT
jgi:D-beta-D-heptose 7-phosphate kinase/D-beta-D-heptose 1-phosphate adenosyltransferase